MTERQWIVLGFIVKYYLDNGGRCPRLTEIAEGSGIPNDAPGSGGHQALYNVDALSRRGLVMRETEKARTIMPTPYAVMERIPFEDDMTGYEIKRDSHGRAHCAIFYV